jgi:hypothetical protein
MTATKSIAIALTLAGFAVAIAAAYHWWKASRVYLPEPVASISDVPELHILNGQVSAALTNNMNARAAFLTGLAAILGTLGSVVGTL